MSVPPFVVRLRSDVTCLVDNIRLVYGDFECLSPDSFADFHIEIPLGNAWERWVKPTAYFYFDGRPVFSPLPAYQAITMLEWGLNWCIAAHSHQYIVFHAAVVEKNGVAVLLPAPPGSGKSTLCAALINRGWRLLSDELALCDPECKQVFGMARPVNLKNASIDIIKAFEPSVVMTKPVPNTSKGNVALMRPPSESVVRVLEPVVPRLIVSPLYSGEVQAELQSLGKSEAFMLLAEQSFNYEMHSREGFRALASMIDRCDCHRLVYSDLGRAIEIFDDLAKGCA